MDDVLLSVVIPFYNAKDTVLRAADSVVHQPCADRVELLLVNDGSKDEGGLLCDRYVETCSTPAQVRVLHKNNGGASSAMNLGIQQAIGRYICFLDADDWWETGFFDESLVELLKENFDLYTFSYQSVSSDMRWRKVYPIEEKEQRGLKPDSDRPFYIRHWACITRREHLVRNHLSYPLCNVNEDVAFVHLVSALAESIKSCDRIMLSYWLNPKSCVHTSSPRTMMDETLKSLRIEKEMFVERGFDYENDRAALSAIAKELPTVCSQMRYRELQKYLALPQFDLLRQDAVKPWDQFSKRVEAYHNHPVLFWLRCQVSPGVTLAVKRFLYRSLVLMRLACFVRYRLKLRWLPFEPPSEWKQEG